MNDYPENKKPSIELCDEILSQIRLRREPQNKKVYNKGEIIVWEADNKERSIAYFGEKEWRGCGAMKNAITHWQEIVLPKKEKL